MNTSGSPPAPTTVRRIPLFWFLRLGVSVLVLVVIFRVVPIQQVWNDARRLPPWLWVCALCLFLAGHAAAAAKWRLLIGGGVSFAQAFRAHLAGLAANLCLPGLAGGDVVRAGLVYPFADDGTRLAVGSVADRLLDIFGLLIIALTGAFLCLAQGQVEYHVLWWFLVAAAAGLGILVPASLVLDRAFERSRPAGRIGRIAAQATSALAYLVRKPHRLILCLAISMAVQATFVGINIALASAVQLEAPIPAWFYAWATAKIVAIAPISLGGLGVREAAMAKLLTPFGADAAQVIAIGLVWQTILYASGLIGVLAQLAWKPDPATVVVPVAPAAAERSS